jgi:phytoene/squalene synthetase
MALANKSETWEQSKLKDCSHFKSLAHPVQRRLEHLASICNTSRKLIEVF